MINSFKIRLDIRIPNTCLGGGISTEVGGEEEAYRGNFFGEDPRPPVPSERKVVSFSGEKTRSSSEDQTKRIRKCVRLCTMYDFRCAIY